jgi:hypothetical protein
MWNHMVSDHCTHDQPLAQAVDAKGMFLHLKIVTLAPAT